MRHEICPEKVRPCRIAMDRTTEVKLPKAGEWGYLEGPMDGIEHKNAPPTAVNEKKRQNGDK
jgi:hypothetical protein